MNKIKLSYFFSEVLCIVEYYHNCYFVLVRAVDGDRGVNNKILYSISGAQDVFGIDSYTGIISTRKTLDREGPATNNGAYIVQISVSGMINILET